jgi:NADPH2:quinone reductase
MKQIILRALGGAGQLRVESISEAPRPGPGQILVDVEAAGVNYIDVMQRKGDLPISLPFTLGSEGVGRIREIGEDALGEIGAATLKIGQRVAWVNVDGSYASQLVFPATRAIPVPDFLTTAQTLLFQALTAQYLANEYREVQPGDRVLVHAAAGGVGQILVQWLKHLGAWVVGTTSSETKAAVVRAAGADAVIIYGQDYAFIDELLSLTVGRGVDLAFDSVGKATFLSTLKGLAKGGTAVVCGASSGPPPAVNPMSLINSCTRIGAGTVYGYVTDPVELQRRASQVTEAVSAGWLRMPEGRAYDLAQAADAHRDLESRTVTGKLYLIP